MKQVAFFSGDITRSGGTERVATVIANGLSHMKDFNVSVISLSHEGVQPFYPLEESIQRTCFKKKWIQPGIGYVPIIFQLISYIKKNNINILIDIDGVLDVLSLPAKFFTGVTVISWEHFNFHQNFGSFYRKPIRKLAARYADCIVTLTKKDQGYYRENLKIRHKITTIHNPMGYMNNMAEISVEKEKKKEENRTKQILSGGNLIHRKGFDYIPKIGRCLKEKYPQLQWEWRIVGEGEERQALTQSVKQCDLEKNILLPGRSEHMEEEYKKADIYVMTSRIEGLPMTLLEAKTFYLPILSFDIPTGPSEIIKDKIDGYLIPVSTEEVMVNEMADKIYLLLNDPQRYQAFKEQTMDNMEGFQLDNILKRWKNLLLSFDSKRS